MVPLDVRSSLDGIEYYGMIMSCTWHRFDSQVEQLASYYKMIVRILLSSLGLMLCSISFTARRCSATLD